MNLILQLQNGDEREIHYFMKSLLAINTVAIVAAGFLTPLWGGFVASIGGDVRTAGIAISVFAIFIGVFTCIAARIEHKFQRHTRTLFITTLLMSCCYGGYFFVHNAWSLYLVQALLGLAAAFQCPAIYTLYSKYMPKTKETLHWGVWNGFYSIALGVAALSSAFIDSYYGFKAVFAALLFISCVGLVLTIITMHRINCFEANS